MSEGSLSKRGVTRRGFLTVAVSAIVAGVVAGVGAYYAGLGAAGPAATVTMPGSATTVTRTTTVTAPPVTTTVTTTRTETVTITAAPPPSERKEIVIGCSLPLTGPNAGLGTSFVRPAYTLWAERINRRGGLLGRPVRLLIYDDASDPAKNTANVEKLITVDKVDLLLGSAGSELAIAQLAVAEKYGYTTTQTHIMPDRSTWDRLKGFKYGFPIANMAAGQTFEEYLKNLLGPWFDYLNEQTDAKTIAIVNGKYSSTGLHAKELAAEYGLRLVYEESYELSLADFVPMMTKVKAANPDVFMSMGLIADAPEQVKAARLVGFNPKAWYIFIGANYPGYLQGLGEAANYTFTLCIWAPTEPWLSQPGVREYIEEAKQYLGRDWLAFQDPMSYTVAHIMGEAVQEAGTIDQEAIRKVFSTHIFNTYFGPIEFQQPPYQLAVPKLTKGKIPVAQIQGNRPVPVWPPDLAMAKPVYPKPPWP